MKKLLASVASCALLLAALPALAEAPAVAPKDAPAPSAEIKDGAKGVPQQQPAEVKAEGQGAEADPQVIKEPKKTPKAR